MGTRESDWIGSNASAIEVRGGRFGKTDHYLNETVVPIPSACD
jgi:hypothetical protein